MGNFFRIALLSTIFFGCENYFREKNQPELNAEKEVRLMFENYHRDIENFGLTAEFKYLDTSENFFWVPPGFTSPLPYDSVRTIVESNAKMFQSVQLQWDTLQLFQLSDQLLNYTGITSGEMVDTTGNKLRVSLIETGIVIKREDGWKLLSGQTANLPLKNME